MTPIRRTDAFQILCGVVAVIGGPILLARGAPAGWSFLLIAAGGVLLVTQSAIAAGVTFEVTDSGYAVLGLVGVACVGLAIVYLTRAANDLPRLFPGYDGDSENFQIVPGLAVLAIGSFALARTLAHTHLLPTARRD